MPRWSPTVIWALGKLHGRSGDRTRAKEQLATATTMYREMDMGLYLAEAVLVPLS
jgi:hypothetical protein